MSDAVLYAVDAEGIAIITINRPEQRNCLSREVRAGLFEAWDRFEYDAAARIAILTGSGENAFCAGGDLKEMVATGLKVPPRDMFPVLYETIKLSKPTIAAVNGVAFAGEIKPLGVVDSIMYPGTQAFMRFDYPSRLPPAAQVQALEVAKKFLNAVGFMHGMFNMEFFYDAATETLKVIEFNPRMASQFSDLYRRVDGLNLHAMALELAHGRDPWALPREVSTAGAASSFVYRVFDERASHLPQRIPTMPSRIQNEQLLSHFPDSLFLQFPKAGHSLARDFKWLGSYRYGILHLSGRDVHDLQERCQRASGILHWPIPYASELSEELSAPMALPSSRLIS